MMKTETIAITPKLAEEYLSGNTMNRSIRRVVVDRYARDMKLGRWAMTHQGIALANDGTLLDGQHRLQAVIKSGVTVMMQVTTGLDIDAFANIDKLTARTDADSLRIDKRMIECAKFFLSYTRTQSKPSVVDVSAVCGRIESLYTMHIAGRNIRTYSCVPIRCAAIMAMLRNPERVNTIAHQYASLLAQDYDSMGAGARLLSKSINTGQAGTATGYTGRIGLFCRALPVFEGNREESIRLTPVSVDYGTDCIMQEFGDIIRGQDKC